MIFKRAYQINIRILFKRRMNEATVEKIYYLKSSSLCFNVHTKLLCASIYHDSTELSVLTHHGRKVTTCYSKITSFFLACSHWLVMVFMSFCFSYRLNKPTM